MHFRDRGCVRTLRPLFVYATVIHVSTNLKVRAMGCRTKVFFKFHFKLMQKFCFQYQFEGKGLWNNSGSSVKLSDKKFQYGRQNPRWLPISIFFSHYASS